MWFKACSVLLLIARKTVYPERPAFRYAPDRPNRTHRRSSTVPMNGRLRIIAILLLVLAPGISAIGWFLHYEQVERPATFHAAGPIELARLDTDVSLDTLLPAATGSRNAAEFYLDAINHYNGRRAPFTQASKLYAFADEPPLEPIELAMLSQGGLQRDCDL